MGERFRKIDPRIWNDARFGALSDDGQLAFIFLLSHPAMTTLGGMRGTADGLAAEKGWAAQRMRRALLELSVVGPGHEFAMVEHWPLLIALPRFLRYNPPNGPNGVTLAWPAAVPLLPECLGRHRVVARAIACVESLSEKFRADPGVQAALDAMRLTIQHAKPDGVGHAMPHAMSDGIDHGLSREGAGSWELGAGSCLTPPDPPRLPGMASDMACPSAPAKRRSARDQPLRLHRDPELTWRIEQCWEHACEARRRFYRSVNGAAGPPPTLTPAIRDAIAAAIELHDSALLAADQRDAWLAASKPYAAGVGLFLDPWMTGEHKDNDLRNGGKRYLEPERAWMPQKGKPDPVGRFAELCFDQRAARQAAAAAKEPTP
jgi:hypothetical protein